MENIVISMGLGNFLSINKSALICYGKRQLRVFHKRITTFLTWMQSYRGTRTADAFVLQRKCDRLALGFKEWTMEFFFFMYDFAIGDLLSFGISHFVVWAAILRSWSTCSSSVSTDQAMSWQCWRGFVGPLGLWGVFETLKSLESSLEDWGSYIAHHIQEVFVQSALIILWNLILGQFCRPVGSIGDIYAVCKWYSLVSFYASRTTLGTWLPWVRIAQLGKSLRLTSQRHFIFATTKGGHTLSDWQGGLLLPQGRSSACSVHFLETTGFMKGRCAGTAQFRPIYFHLGISFSIIWVWEGFQTNSLTFGDQVHGHPPATKVPKVLDHGNIFWDHVVQTK